jgi:hypothetical protein
MIELIIFILFIFCFIYLLFSNASLRIKNAEYKYELLKSYADFKILLKQVEQLENTSNNGLDQDSFFKFISDSRDIAFEYIEEIQSKLLDFDNLIKLKIAENNMLDQEYNYKEKYENLVLVLFTEIDKLKELLPKENEDGR